MINYYQILRIEKFSNQKEVKQAFRKLAKVYHPDINPIKNSHDEFVLIYEAYDILSNIEKKQIYDQELRAKIQNAKNINSLNEWSQQANFYYQNKLRYLRFVDFFKVVFDKALYTAKIIGMKSNIFFLIVITFLLVLAHLFFLLIFIYAIFKSDTGYSLNSFLTFFGKISFSGVLMVLGFTIVPFFIERALIRLIKQRKRLLDALVS